MATIIVLVILSILVLIHEWGHYIVAKKTGTRVLEFGFGYPPRLLKIFARKGTIFSLNGLPFGGFVRLAGDDAEIFDGPVVDEFGTEVPKKELFAEQSQWKRLAVVLAGAFINIAFGVIAFSLLYFKMGIPEQLPNPLVQEVAVGSPAESAQIKSGDVVLKLNGELVISSQMFITKIQEFRGKTVSVVVKRDDSEVTLQPYVRTLAETPANQGGLGVMLTDVELRFYPWYIMIPKGIQRGLQESYAFSMQILSALRSMVATVVRDHAVPKDVSGPIGIVYMAGKEKVFEQGPWAWLNFAGLLSINLGVMNLLPIPALDGGRAFFILIEGLIGKKRRSQIEHHANAAGMLLLLSFIVFISLKDVWMIVGR